MADRYGVTSQGFVKKRLDVIREEMQAALSSGLGINVAANQESYLNVLLTNFAEKIAELWEVAEESHFAHYPSTASAQNLDDVGQLGGSIRAKASSTEYMILCTGRYSLEPNKIVTITPDNTIISTENDPKIELIPLETIELSIAKCNRVILQPQVAPTDEPIAYKLTIDGKEIEVLYQTSDLQAFLHNLVNNITDSLSYVEAVADYDNGKVIIYCVDELSQMEIKLPDNKFNVSNVSCLAKFKTSLKGNFELYNGSITNILTGPTGLEEVVNVGTPTSGRLDATDAEFRIDYANKIFIRSRTMLDSIVSALWSNVSGVRTAAAYQNDTNVWQGHRAPHSVETVIDVGNTQFPEVARNILNTKAAGIQSCNCCGVYNKGETVLPMIGIDALDNYEHGKDSDGDYVWIENQKIYVQIQKRLEDDIPNELDTVPLRSSAHCVMVYDDVYKNEIPVRFSTPIPVKLLWRIEMVSFYNEALAPNIFGVIKDTIKNMMSQVAPGTSVVPKRWLNNLYSAVSGISVFRLAVSTFNSSVESDVGGKKFYAFYDDYSDNPGTELATCKENKFIKVSDESELPEIGDSDCVYYVENRQAYLVWDDDDEAWDWNKLENCAYEILFGDYWKNDNYLYKAVYDDVKIISAEE